MDPITGMLSINGKLIPVELIECTVTHGEYSIYTLQGRPFNFEISNNIVPVIKKVIFNDPATIVKWKDGTKTVVKCQDGDTYSKELGLAMCIAKKALGNKGNYYDVFKKYLETEEAS